MMTFAVTDDNRDRMEDFIHSLFSNFPGSVLYVYTNPMDMLDCLRDHQVNAVFVEAVMEDVEGIRILVELRERTEELPVFILADNDEYEDDAIWNDATGYLIRPISGEELRNAVGGIEGS